MASEKQAERAARKLTPMLRKRQAIAVDVRKLPRQAGYAVFALFEKKPEPELPTSTTITVGDKRIVVPVRVVVTEAFRPD
jgi:hypothetical protein